MLHDVIGGKRCLMSAEACLAETVHTGREGTGLVSIAYTRTFDVAFGCDPCKQAEYVCTQLPF